MFNLLFDTFKKCLAIISCVYKKVKEGKRNRYRIVQIDMINKRVSIGIVGKAIVINLSPAEIVCDNSMLNGFSSTEACWIGICYSKTINQIEHNRGKHKNGSAFFLKSDFGRYKLLSQDRKGEISYFDFNTQTVNLASPIDLAQDDHFIANLDASQACYIGILAGIELEKNEMQLSIKVKGKVQKSQICGL